MIQNSGLRKGLFSEGVQNQSLTQTINGIAKSATQFGKISQHDLMELGQLMEELVELVEKQVKEDKQRIAKK